MRHRELEGKTRLKYHAVLELALGLFRALVLLTSVHCATVACGKIQEIGASENRKS